MPPKGPKIHVPGMVPGLAAAACFVLAWALLPSESWAQANSRSERYPAWPGADQVWVWIDPRADGGEDLLERIRQIAWDQGYQVLEYDLTNIQHLWALYDLKAIREIRWSEEVEMYVGKRALIGKAEIQVFLPGWVAGTEPLDPPDPPPRAAGDSKPREGGTVAKAGAGSAVEGSPPEPAPPGPVVERSPGPERFVSSPETRKGKPDAPAGVLGWLESYRFSILALLAAAVFIGLSFRRGAQSKHGP